MRLQFIALFLGLFIAAATLAGCSTPRIIPDQLEKAIEIQPEACAATTVTATTSGWATWFFGFNPKVTTTTACTVQ